MNAHKALTLTQPWASLVALERKTIETRSWSTNYRGELVIHSAKSFPRADRELCETAPFFLALGGMLPEHLPLSRGLCVVRLLACIPTTEIHKAEFVLGNKPSCDELRFGNFAPGRFAWILHYLYPLKDVGPVRGALGLWTWPDDALRQTAREQAVASKEAR